MNMDMDSSSMAMSSSTMAMASSTLTMDMASSTMDMSSSTSSSSMDMDLMNMYFTKSYNDYPVLFLTLKATNGGEAFGIFVLLFFIGVFTKFFEFLRNYLEQRVWVERPALHTSDSDSIEKTATESPVKGPSTNIPALIIRNAIRIVLIFVPEMFGFALMLAAMSFNLIYFFAVVSGLTIGKFIFERLGAKMNLVEVPVLQHHG